MKNKIGAQSELLGLILVISLTLLISCGGGGNESKDEIFKNLNGAWAGPCKPKGDVYGREKLVFYDDSKQMTYIIEEFQTMDCFFAGTAGTIIRGFYDTGDEIDCLNGISGKCTELDISLEENQDDFLLYSIDASEDPYRLFLSEPSNDRESRSEDVEINKWYHKVSLLFYRDSDGDGYGDPSNSIESEILPDGYVSNNDDPDDNNPAVNPGIVIVEIGTGTWCTYCPGAAFGADDLVENGHRVGVINYHQGDTYATVASAARVSYYEIDGFPTAYFDGVSNLVGGSASGSIYEAYLPKYETLVAVPPLFFIDARYHNTGGNNYRLAVETNQLGDYPSPNPDIVLQVVLTESHIPLEWQGTDALNFVCRAMIPDQNGTELDFGLSTTQFVSLDFTIPENYVADNLELVVFIQDNTTKEILQGVLARLVADID